ncbi:MAG: acyltransferase [Clostridia bacterium]|nr:acyltransferase [Clostridia bacterium]
MNKIVKAYRILKNSYGEAIKPKKYAKQIGVNIADSVRITGHIKWGSEPWLVSVGENTTLADGVTFTTHDGAVNVVNKEEKYKDIIKFGRIDIGKNCFVGAGARFMPDVIVGDNSIIGAASLVTKDVPAGQVWAGVPARFICTTEEYAEKTLAETPLYDTENLKRNMREESIKIANMRRDMRRKG